MRGILNSFGFLQIINCQFDELLKYNQKYSSGHFGHKHKYFEESYSKPFKIFIAFRRKFFFRLKRFFVVGTFNNKATNVIYYTIYVYQITLHDLKL